MTETERVNLEIVKAYVSAVEQYGETERFLAPDVVQEEFPNRFLPNGARRDLAALREAGERGKRAMRSQRLEILHAMASGTHVALEVQWSGILAGPIGALRASGEMRARFAIFVELRDGKIVAMRNYDCFDPF